MTGFGTVVCPLKLQLSHQMTITLACCFVVHSIEMVLPLSDHGFNYYLFYDINYIIDRRLRRLAEVR